jgi:hypothetical protein
MFRPRRPQRALARSSRAAALNEISYHIPQNRTKTPHSPPLPTTVGKFTCPNLKDHLVETPSTELDGISQVAPMMWGCRDIDYTIT